MVSPSVTRHPPNLSGGHRLLACALVRHARVPAPSPRWSRDARRGPLRPHARQGRRGGWTVPGRPSRAPQICRGSSSGSLTRSGGGGGAPPPHRRTGRGGRPGADRAPLMFQVDSRSSAVLQALGGQNVGWTKVHMLSESGWRPVSARQISGTWESFRSICPNSRRSAGRSWPTSGTQTPSEVSRAPWSARGGA